MTFQIDLAYGAVVSAVTVRCTVLAATLPLLDRRSVPLLWRLAVAVVVALAVSPVVVQQMDLSSLQITWATVFTEVGRSLLVGALLSFAVGLIFTAVRYAGQIMGMQIGFAIVNVIDPQNGTQISVLSQLYYLLAFLLFFAVDGHHTLLVAMVHSCTVLPIFGPIAHEAGAWLLLKEYSQVFSIGLQIAAPCVIVLLRVSATMGVVVKTVPQLNVLVVGFPIKIGVGLLTVGLSLTFFKDVFLLLMQGMEERMTRLIAALM